MIFVLMAAHDTSTITLTMMLYYLARKPEWQERLRAESDGLGTETPSYEQLDALTSFDLVFRETLRMNAPVGMVARRAVRDAAVDGHFVPAGTLLMLQIYPTHRMEPWWRDPDRFDPTRFDAEHIDEPGPRESWLPFGSHAHKCIGMHFGRDGGEGDPPPPAGDPALLGRARLCTPARRRDGALSGRWPAGDDRASLGWTEWSDDASATVICRSPRSGSVPG